MWFLAESTRKLHDSKWFCTAREKVGRKDVYARWCCAVCTTSFALLSLPNSITIQWNILHFTMNFIFFS